MNPKRNLECMCPACLDSERLRTEIDVPYQYQAGRPWSIYHLVLYGSVPLAGMLMIGWSWLMIVPIAGFIAGYLFNSLYFCPTCSYHHSDAASCVCYPKSPFPYKRYRGKPWEDRDNIIGWPILIMLTIGPTIAVLWAKGDGNGIIIVFITVIVIIFLTSMVSCPRCRQRSFCFLGRL